MENEDICLSVTPVGIFARREGSYIKVPEHLGENFEIIEDIISTIQNEIILFCALLGIEESFDISNFIKYFEDYGMEAELHLIKNMISETQ